MTPRWSPLDPPDQHPAIHRSQGAALPASAGKPVPVDPFPRRRDREGSRLGSGFAYHFPVPEDRPLAETHLAVLLDDLRQTDPAQAAWLHHLYDQRLLPALRHFRAVAAAAFDESQRERVQEEWDEECRHAAWRARREATEAALAAHQSTAERLAHELQLAQREAAERCAMLGCLYDPRGLEQTEAQLLAVGPSAGTEVACDPLRSPSAPAVRGGTRKLLSGMGTVAIGVFLGLSLGLLGGFLQAEELDRQVGTVVGFALLGCGPAYWSRLAIVCGHRYAAEQGASRPGRLSLNPLLLTALALDAAFLLLDALVEREGLLRLRSSEAALQALSVAAPSMTAGHDPVWLLAPLLLTLGYVACAAWEGEQQGREALARRQQAQAIAQQAGERTAARCADPVLQRALLALSRVRCLQHALAELTAQAYTEREHWQRNVAAFEARRDQALAIPSRAELLVQDAHDDLLGADAEFRAALGQALATRTPDGRHAPRSSVPGMRREPLSLSTLSRSVRRCLAGLRRGRGRRG